MDSTAELVFHLTKQSDDGCCAEGLTGSICTQGDSWEELEVMIKDAVDGNFFWVTKDLDPFALNWKMAPVSPRTKNPIPF